MTTDPAAIDLDWQAIETAPKDGRLVVLLSRGDQIETADETIIRLPTCFLGKWDPDGDSWVDRDGNPNCADAYTLSVTGVWDCEGGWLQPDEVTNWSPVPLRIDALGKEDKA